MPGNNVYMVRALKLETSASGTYFNLSRGIVDSTSAGTGEVDQGILDPIWSQPNPFRDETMVCFVLREPSIAELRIHDVRGSYVRTLHDGPLRPGEHGYSWAGRDADGRAVPSGVYFYTLTSSESASTRKMILVR